MMWALDSACKGMLIKYLLYVQPVWKKKNWKIKFSLNSAQNVIVKIESIIFMISTAAGSQK